MILAYPGPFKPSPRQKKTKKRPRIMGRKVIIKFEMQLAAAI